MFKNKQADVANKSKPDGKDKEKGKKDSGNEASAAQVILIGFRIDSKSLFCFIGKNVFKLAKCLKQLPQMADAVEQFQQKLKPINNSFVNKIESIEFYKLTVPIVRQTTTTQRSSQSQRSTQSQRTQATRRANNNQDDDNDDDNSRMTSTSSNTTNMHSDVDEDVTEDVDDSELVEWPN